MEEVKEANGAVEPEVIQAPAILVVWNEQDKAVSLKCDMAAFKNWAFIHAVLSTAADLAKSQMQFQMVNAMQAQAIEQAKFEAIRKTLR